MVKGKEYSQKDVGGEKCGGEQGRCGNGSAMLSLDIFITVYYPLLLEMTSAMISMPLD